MTQSLLNRVPVIPVVVVDDVDHAVPIARALVAGGLPVIELTLRTPVALTAIERIAGEVPEIFIGAGTIVEPSQAKQAASAGAQFLVSPGSTPTLLQAMTDSGLPHLPGVATVSEILTALEAGYTELKFFPAEAAGGANSSSRSAHRSRRHASARPAASPPPTPTSIWRCRTSDASEAPGSRRPTFSYAATGRASPNWPPPPRRSEASAEPADPTKSSGRGSWSSTLETTRTVRLGEGYCRDVARNACYIG